MSDLILRPINNIEDRTSFIIEVQEAFQRAYEEEFGEYDKKILPVEDILDSFNADGAVAYTAETDGKRVGGAIVAIDGETHYNSLHLLYVNPSIQNVGYGYKIWKKIEDIYPETKVWETHTPYFDKRNIHFYVNRCGFKIVEFFNPAHPDPHQLGETSGNIPPENDYFFRFEKVMK